MNFNVRPKDAVHVATAIHHNIGILETFDEGLLAIGPDRRSRTNNSQANPDPARRA